MNWNVTDNTNNSGKQWMSSVQKMEATNEQAAPGV